jgi:hypothetical protein
VRTQSRSCDPSSLSVLYHIPRRPSFMSIVSG